jgi:hypothetical protein
LCLDVSRAVHYLDSSRCILILRGHNLKTQRQFKEVYEAIRALMDTPAPKRRGIGFTADIGEKA